MSDLSGLRQILSPQFLSETYSKVASLTSYNPMLDFFHRPTEYDGDEIEVVRLDSVSEPAPMNLRGQAARTLDAQGLETVRFTPIHAFNEVTIPMSAIEYLRQTDSPRVQERGIQELRRQMEAFGRRHRALRAVVLAKALTTGVIYWDPQSGSVMETPTDIKIDLGVSDEHKGLLDHSAFGAEIISAAWDQPDTKILSQLDSMREAAEFDKAPPPRHIWLHTSAKEWFRNNNQIKGYLQTNPQLNLELLKSLGDTMVIGDYVFHFFAGTYLSVDHEMKPLIPKDKAVMTPDLGEWFRHYETSETFPLADGIVNTFDGIVANTAKVFGDFAYLRIHDNPVKVTMRMGMNFLYAFADPNAIWMPTVDF